MTYHRYPREALGWDLARDGAGILVCGGALLLPTHWVVLVLLVPFLAVFVVHLLMTVRRVGCVVELREDGLVERAFRPRGIAWGDVSRLRLRYFSTRRDRKEGWMELVVGAGTRRIAIESSLSGFDHVAARATEAALANGVTMDETTKENLLHIGVDLPEGPSDDEDWVSRLSKQRSQGASSTEDAR